MILILPFMIVLLVAGPLAFAQNLERSVIGNGGGRLSTANSAVRGTVGQPAIGRVGGADSKHNLGFWYRSHSGGTVVAVPNREGEIGTTTTVQIMLMSSKGLVDFGPRSFVITLRYNSTVLVNKSTYPCTRSGDDCVLTVTGTMRDSVGVLAEIPFLITLGNAEHTDLIIDSVEWVGAGDVSTTKFNGRFQALGLCEEGDSVRLIRRGPVAGITRIAPQPVAVYATATTFITDDGPTRMILINTLGREIAVVMDVASIQPGEHEVPLDLTEVASGQYYLVLMTPTDLYSEPIMIRK